MKRTAFVGARVPEWLFELLERHAKRCRMSISEIVRLGLEGVLNGEIKTKVRILSDVERRAKQAAGIAAQAVVNKAIADYEAGMKRLGKNVPVLNTRRESTSKNGRPRARCAFTREAIAAFKSRRAGVG